MISEFVATQQNRLDVEANHAHAWKCRCSLGRDCGLWFGSGVLGTSEVAWLSKRSNLLCFWFYHRFPLESWHICASSGLRPLDPSNHLIHYKNNPSKTGQKALTKEQNHPHFLCTFQFFWGSKLKGNYSIFTPLRWLSPMSSTGCDTDIASFTMIKHD